MRNAGTNHCAIVLRNYEFAVDDPRRVSINRQAAVGEPLEMVAGRPARSRESPPNFIGAPHQ